MRRILIVLFCLAVQLSPDAASRSAAQAGSAAIFIHNVMATPTQTSADGVPALKVNALFSLLDSTGMPTSAEIDSVVMKVGQDRYTSTFGKPSGDWAIAVLIDTSGTLAGPGTATDDFRRVIEGFSKSLDRMPQNALYTIITVDSSVKIIEEFTKDKEAVTKCC